MSRPGQQPNPALQRLASLAAELHSPSPFTFMSRFALIFVAVALLLPGLVLAKRVAPAKVEPVIHQGVRYTAPNDDGRRAYIEAWDVQNNKKL